MELNQYDLYWCCRRMPKDVMTMVKEKSGKLIVAGGFIRCCITGEPISDIDLFAPTVEDAKSWAYELVGRGHRRKQVETKNAITVYGLKTPIQFIHRWTYASPEQVLQSFDFTVACSALWWEGDKDLGYWKTLCHNDYYADLAAKRLVYLQPDRNEDAGGSLLRVLKFYQKGYRIPLDSLGAAMARLVMAVKLEEIDRGNRHDTELQWSKVLTGLLREVDPNIDPRSFRPSSY